MIIEVTLRDEAFIANSASTSVTITITDENDNAPSCVPSAYFLSLDEDVAIGFEVVKTLGVYVYGTINPTQVQQISCTDADSSSVLTYTIISGNTGNDFDIDNSGKVTTLNG